MAELFDLGAAPFRRQLPFRDGLFEFLAILALDAVDADDQGDGRGAFLAGEGRFEAENRPAGRQEAENGPNPVDSST